MQAGCEQHKISYKLFREGLIRSDIMLDRKTLANLACWEPYTFKALTDIAQRRVVDDGLATPTSDTSLDRIITRSCLSNKSEPK